MKKVKSARGEVVDFNLLRIKEEIASAPTTTEVRARQDFIDKRLRRRVKTIQPQPQKIDVDPNMPQPETEVAVKQPVEEKEPAVKQTRQKARPKIEGDTK